MAPLLKQVNISEGGMPKHPVTEARVTANGIVGDRQRILKYHGGPNRAVCLYSEELYEWLRDLLGTELPLGSIGENFTSAGLDLGGLKPGSRLRVGGCVIEITAVRIPCNQLKKWDPDLPELIVGRSGWVAKVIEEGVVRPGDSITVLRPEPEPGLASRVIAE
jgi:MOSC domain-containing protein YiiM